MAGVVGGILMILLDLAFIVFFGDDPERVAAATTTWLILLDLSLFAAYLGLLALIGLYARQVEESGGLGLAAFILASLGMVMNIGFHWGGGFIVPALTSTAPEFLDQVEANPPTIVAVGFISTFALFALGWLLLGVASLRAKVLPRAPLWLLIVAAILGLVSRFADLGIASVLFGVALAWLGWWLWRE
jgi:tetrahydromethanopterin S-methyltransferase subunit E